MTGIALDSKGDLYICDINVYRWRAVAPRFEKMMSLRDPTCPAFVSCAVDDQGRVLAVFDDMYPGVHALLLEPRITEAKCFEFHDVSVRSFFDGVIAVSSILWNRVSHKKFPYRQRNWAVFVYWSLSRDGRSLDAVTVYSIIAYALNALSVPAHFV